LSQPHCDIFHRFAEPIVQVQREAWDYQARYANLT